MTKKVNQVRWDATEREHIYCTKRLDLQCNVTWSRGTVG